jgi:hypothetical protein
MVKVFGLLLAVFFIYTLTFDIFLSNFFRIPTPLLSCIPLIIFFRIKNMQFLYGKEMAFFIASAFLYYFIGVDNIVAFSVNSFIFVTTALYFNYFVGTDSRRFNISVSLFFVLLTISTVIMLLNQFMGSDIVAIRALLIDNEIRQSPSGLSATIFGFGYQLAALVTFLLIYCFVKRKNVWIIAAVFILGLVSIYFGLQRSVLVAFLSSGLMFVVLYYKSRSAVILGVAFAFGLLLYNYALESQKLGTDNILAKSDRDGGTESRDGMVAGNLEIITDYPYGLIFYGKDWTEVTIGNPVFPNGLTSHNAYLMYITYLGPFLGIGLLFLLHKSIIEAFRYAMRNINQADVSLLICLLFAFISICINAMFHNASIITANGPTVFLFFSVLHLRTLIKMNDSTLYT